MNPLQQNILVQKLIEYKMRKNNMKSNNKGKVSPQQYSPPKMPISQRQTSYNNAYSVHQRLKQIQIDDLIELLAQMFRIVQQLEISASHLWQRNIEMLGRIKVPEQDEILKLKQQLESYKQNDIQNSLFGQLKEYSDEKPKCKVIDLDNIKKDQNFQEEFMAKANEFSLSWRQEVQQLKHQ